MASVAFVILYCNHVDVLLHISILCFVKEQLPTLNTCLLLQSRVFRYRNRFPVCTSLSPNPIGSAVISYTYDTIGQLIKADDPTDPTAGNSGTTWKYTYDHGGNILTKKAYVYGTTTEVTANRISYT